MLASLKPEEDGHTELGHLIEGYKLCAGSEGKSRNTIDIVTNSVKYFYEFLGSTHRPTDVNIGTQEMGSPCIFGRKSASQTTLSAASSYGRNSLYKDDYCT